ncbi:hypothetical protein [Ponticaulis profundi]|uniref:ABM domain-containing protein n=1 Tax=Ponticaulis profundi TaxID=2665222 RepID=A0ABW1SEB3_9PROT
MSNVVVHVAVGDQQAETRFADAMETFTRTQTSGAGVQEITIKDVMSGQSHRKAVSFADREAASQFLLIWRGQSRRP